MRPVRDAIRFSTIPDAEVGGLLSDAPAGRTAYEGVPQRLASQASRCVWAEDGIDQRHDLVHSSIDIEGEACQIQSFELRAVRLQANPGLIFGKIHAHRFIEAISQVAQPAQEIAEVNQAYQSGVGSVL